MVTHRRGVPEVDACKRWLLALAERGMRIGIPEIADQEVRRELLRAGKTQVDAKLWREVVAGGDLTEYLPTIGDLHPTGSVAGREGSSCGSLATFWPCVPPGRRRGRFA